MDKCTNHHICECYDEQLYELRVMVGTQANIIAKLKGEINNHEENLRNRLVPINNEIKITKIELVPKN